MENKKEKIFIILKFALAELISILIVGLLVNTIVIKGLTQILQPLWLVIDTLTIVIDLIILCLLLYFSTKLIFKGKKFDSKDIVKILMGFLIVTYIIIAVCVIMFCYFMHIFINTEEEIYISGAIVEIEDSVVSNQVNQIRLLQARNIAIASISLTIIFTLIILILERKWINRFNQISEEEIKLQRKQIIKLCIIPLILIAIEIIAIIIVYNNKDDEIAQINIIMKTTATSKETDYVYEEIKQIEEIESIEIESKEEVLEELENKFNYAMDIYAGENNIFPDTIKIEVKQKNAEEVYKEIKEISSPYIERIQKSEDLLE